MVLLPHSELILFSFPVSFPNELALFFSPIWNIFCHWHVVSKPFIWALLLKYFSSARSYGSSNILSKSSVICIRIGHHWCTSTFFSINSSVYFPMLFGGFFSQLNFSPVLYTSLIFLPFINTYSLSSSGGDSYHYLNLLNTNIRKTLLIIVVKLGR